MEIEKETIHKIKKQCQKHSNCDNCQYRTTCNRIWQKTGIKTIASNWTNKITEVIQSINF